MKKFFGKEKGVAKGAPSGFVISLLVHIAAFLVAGMLVVFNVVKKEEKQFVPPKPIERPKMDLKKPKVKIKKSSKPKPTTRIVTKMNKASMPDIQLPEMSGISDGLAGDLGGFDITPDFGAEVNVFGGGQTIGNDFEGTFYDLKRDRRGRDIPMDPVSLEDALSKFVRSDWNPSKLARYYRSPNKLYTTCFSVPEVLSSLAPTAFGEADTDGWCWVAHYKGKLVCPASYPNGITFRFWGMGDDLMIVRVDGEFTLISSWPGGSVEAAFSSLWSSHSSDTLSYPLGINLSVVGDWITLEPDTPLDMEVLISEIFGGAFQAMLLVEVEGEEYPRNPFMGGPTLPIFKTSEIPLDLAEVIHGDLDPGDASVTNGPVFCDYEISGWRTDKEENKTDSSDTNLRSIYSDNTKIRVWNFVGGRTMKAEYKTMIGDKVVLENSRGKQVKILLSKLSPEDQTFIEFKNPPKFDISFSKKGTQVQQPPQSPFRGSAPAPPWQVSDHIYGVKLKAESVRSYNHELRVEYFVFAEEVDGDNYVFVDHQEFTFFPASEKKGSFSFYSKNPVRIQSTAMRDSAPMRGIKYGGYLVAITDEHGEMIQYETSHKWLFKSLENLKRVPLGKHFNKEGIRVGPPRPGPASRRDLFFK